MKPSDRIMVILKRDYHPRPMEKTAALELAKLALELSNAIVTYLDEVFAPKLPDLE